VISGVVGAGPAEAQQPGQGFTARIEIGDDRVEAEPVLVGRRGVDRVGMRVQERAVQVDHDLVGRGTRRPRHRSRRRPRRGDGAQPNGVHRVDHPEHGRIRRHRAEQVGLVTHHGDVGHTVAPIRQRHRQMGEHDTGIMRRAALASVGHRLLQPVGETDPIRQLAQQQSPGVTRHARAVTGHLHPPRRPCTVHFGSAVLVGFLRLRQAQFPLRGGHPRGPTRATRRSLPQAPG
jgi:hypothetical protein